MYTHRAHKLFSHLFVPPLALPLFIGDERLVRTYFSRPVGPTFDMTARARCQQTRPARNLSDEANSECLNRFSLRTFVQRLVPGDGYLFFL